MYASEALAAVNRLAEAASLLNVDCLVTVRITAAQVIAAATAPASTGGKLGQSAPVPDTIPSTALTVDEATCALHVNLGVVHLAMVRFYSSAVVWVAACCRHRITVPLPSFGCVQGDVNLANDNACLALAAQPMSVHARRLAVCIALVRGDHAAAVAVLKGAPRK